MLTTRQHGPVTEIILARPILGRILKDVRAYWVADMLIDSGPPATAEETLRWAQRRGIGVLVNTHQHEDHVGANAALASAFKLVPLVPAETLPILARPPRIPFYRRLVWGTPLPSPGEALGLLVEWGEYSFQIIPTPGHSPDHICLYEPRQKWLFSGDLFVHERVKYIRQCEDVSAILSSLRRVLNLDFDTLFCSHAGMVLNGRAAVERKIAWWEQIGQQACELRRRGQSLPAIRDQLLGTEGLMARISGGEFSKLNLIRAFVQS